MKTANDPTTTHLPWPAPDWATTSVYNSGILVHRGDAQTLPGIGGGEPVEAVVTRNDYVQLTRGGVQITHGTVEMWIDGEPFALTTADQILQMRATYVGEFPAPRSPID